MLVLDCPRENAYLAIVITILPLWIMITTLIVFLVLAFHKNLRSNKIYDNCVKGTAHHAYHVEIRTGETSSSYNRLRTTIFIDVFDDAQTTLAKIAVPSHIIFGRRGSLNSAIEDDKYPELRVARFWLYRQSKLRRVTTIRLSHSCLEPEAKIMIYGIELRSTDRDRPKLFFPIMNYISAYGPTNKPGGCFDAEQSASISIIGGSQSDSSTITEQLSYVDYTVLAYFAMASIFILSTCEIMQRGFKEYDNSAYHGLLVGCISFTLSLGAALLMRFVFKRNYSLNISVGSWAIAYYTYNIFILIVGTSFWIFTTIYTYNKMCPQTYDRWILSVGIAMIECGVLALTITLGSWIVQQLSPLKAEQYVLPEDREDSRGRYKSESKRPQHQPNQPMLTNGGPPMAPPQTPTQGWPTIQHYPYLMPTNVYGQPVILGSIVSPPRAAPTQPGQQTSGPSNQAPNQQSPYGQQTVGSGGYNFQDSGQQQVAGQPPMHHQAPTLQPQSAQQQSTQRPQPTVGGGIKPSKKVGSNESTGSTYYQQLMKNKGGVKSISQYGELLRQKKTSKKT